MIPKEKSKSKKNKSDGKQKINKQKEANEGWVVFLDFHEITHAVVKDTTVSIFGQNNKRMVRLSYQLIKLRDQASYSHKITHKSL